MPHTGAVIHSRGGPPELQAPPDASPAVGPARLVGAGFAAIGLVLVIVGSFLPWVVSGQVRRSSYEIAGVLDRLDVAQNGVVAELIAGWPLIGVLCVTPLVAAGLRWWRTAGWLSMLIGLPVLCLAGGVLLIAGGRAGTVRLDPVGPAVMTAGALLLCIGGAILAFGGVAEKRIAIPEQPIN